MTLANILTRLRACKIAIQWAEPYDHDFERAWNECRNNRWLTWLAINFNIDANKLIKVLGGHGKAREHISFPDMLAGFEKWKEAGCPLNGCWEPIRNKALSQ